MRVLPDGVHRVRVQLTPSYILHVRPYRDSSLLVDLFTQEYGRLGGVLRAGRRRGRTSALPEPLRRLLVSWSGRGELVTLGAMEAAAPPIVHRGRALFAALYINELLYRCLHSHDPHPGLFTAYGRVLDDLAASAGLEGVLRRFEFLLLEELGYGLNFRQDAGSGGAIDPHFSYHFDDHHGFVKILPGEGDGQHYFSGEVLLALAQGDFSSPLVQLPARRLARRMLRHLLGERSLGSRSLWRGLPPGALP